MPTANLYVDFGDNFPAGGVLQDTVGNFFAVAGNLGPEYLVDSSGLYHAAWTAELSRFDKVYFGWDTAALRRDIMALVRRAFAPFDVNVVELTGNQGARTLADVAAKLSFNNPQSSAEPFPGDAYVLVGDLEVTGASGVFNPATMANGYGGRANGQDMSTGHNESDGLAWVAANLKYQNQGMTVTFTANQIAHEAGHLFALLHTYGESQLPSPFPLDILRSDTMSDLPVSKTMFTRFPLPAGDGNTSNDVVLDAYGQLANDVVKNSNGQDVSLVGKSNIEYVTGTGAHDKIEVTVLSATKAKVTVQAFADTAYTQSIDVPGPTPGTTHTYEIDLTKDLIIDAGFGDDMIELDADLDINIKVRGMNGTDRLVIRGESVDSGSYEPNATFEKGLGSFKDSNNNALPEPESYGGKLTFGNTVISFIEFEATSSIQVDSVNNFTFKSPGGADDLKVDSPAAGVNRISGTIDPAGPDGAVAFVPLLFSKAASVTIDVGNKDSNPTDDKVSIESPGLVATDLRTFAIKTGNGDDLLTAASAPSLPVSGTVSLVFDGEDGNDTIKGDDVSATWKITGKNEGTVNDRTSFKNVENLTGGALDDIFKFQPGGSVDGNINGDIDSDTLDLSALTGPMRAAVNVTGPGSIPDGDKGTINVVQPLLGGFDNINVILYPAGVTITQSAQGTTVEEGGGAVSYTVELDAPPTAEVQIAVTPHAALQVSTNLLTFTPADWNQPQTVFVFADEDGLKQGTRTLPVAHVAVSADLRYIAVSTVNLNVTVTEHEQLTRTPVGFAVALSPAVRREAIKVHPALPDGGFSAGTITVGYGYSFGSVSPTVVATDAAGNVYVAGSYGGGSVNFRGAALSSMQPSSFVAKYKASTGELDWIHSFTTRSNGGWCNANAIVVDSKGNVYVTGSFRLNVDFDPLRASGEQRTPGGISELGFLAKLNSAGTFISVKVLPGIGTSVSVDTLNNVYVVDAFNYTSADRVTKRNQYTRFTPGGTMALQRPFVVPKQGVTFTGSAVDKTGNLYVAGSTDTDVFLFKFDKAGRLIRTRQVNTGGSFSVVLALDEANNVYLGADFDTRADFGAGTEPILATNGNVFVAKWDPAGKRLWANAESEPGDFITGLAVDRSGNVYSAGSFGLTKRAASGTILLAQPDAIVSVLAVSTYGEIYSVGATVAPTDFQPGPGTLVVTGRKLGDIDPSVSSFTYVPAGVVLQLLDENERRPPGVTVTQSLGATVVTEDEGFDSYTVVLDSRPTSNVAIEIRPTAQLRASTAKLTFSPSDWYKPQTVKVTAIDDLVSQGVHTAVITHVASSADTAYQGIASNDVTATIHENPKVRISQSGGSTAVTEGGARDNYSVVLTKKPKTDIIIGIRPDKQMTTSVKGVTVTTLTFTPANWNVPQLVTVTASDDKVDEGDHAGTIRHIWLQASANFKAVTMPPLALTIRDNDFAGVKIVQTNGTAVKEGGTTDTYTMRLTSQPKANVTIRLDPSTQLGVSRRDFTFTPGNWSTPQTVTVTAVNDRNAEGKHTGVIMHAAVSADPKYASPNLTIANVIVAIADNDRAAFRMARNVNESDTDSDTFQQASSPQSQSNFLAGPASEQQSPSARDTAFRSASEQDFRELDHFLLELRRRPRKWW